MTTAASCVRDGCESSICSVGLARQLVQKLYIKNLFYELLDPYTKYVDVCNFLKTVFKALNQPARVPIFVAVLFLQLISYMLC